MTAEHQLGIYSQLDRPEPHLLEPFDRPLGKRFVLQVGERRAAPEVERARQEVESTLRVGARECGRRLCRQAFEPVQVELSRADAKDVSRRTRLDRRGRPEGLSELRDLSLHLRDGGNRRGLRVELVREPLDRDNSVGIQDQDRKRRALPRPSEAHGSVLRDDLHRPEDPELQHSRGR